MSESCRICGGEVHISIRRGSGICCGNCEKEAQTRAVASATEHQRRRDEEYARRCRGGSVSGRMCRRIAPAGAELPWKCHDHRENA